MKIKSKIRNACMTYINKHLVILSQYHNRWVSMWVTKLVNYVLLDYYLQISSHSTLSLRTWEGPMVPVSPGAPKSLARPCHKYKKVKNFANRNGKFGDLLTEHLSGGGVRPPTPHCRNEPGSCLAFEHIC